MKFDEKPSAKILVSGNVGQLNFAEKGDIHIHQNTSETDSIETLAKTLIELLYNNGAIPTNVKEETIDYIETAVEQTENDKPKKSILKSVTEKLHDVKMLVGEGTETAVKADKLIELFSRFLNM